MSNADIIELQRWQASPQSSVNMAMDDIEKAIDTLIDNHRITARTAFPHADRDVAVGVKLRLIHNRLRLLERLVQNDLGVWP